MSDELRSFAERHRLRVRRDVCGDLVILGRFGQLYEHGSGVFGLLLQVLPDHPRLDKTLRIRRRKAIDAGFVHHQWGDSEAIVLFDPNTDVQARLAIKLAGIKRRRISSANQIANLRRGPGRDQRQSTDGAKTRPVSLRRLTRGKTAGDAPLSENRTRHRISEGADCGKLSKPVGNHEGKIIG